MERNRGKTAFLRCLGCFLVVLAPVFGVTWKPTGFCLGDKVLASLGLKAWSDGSQGLHYAALYGLAMLLGGCILFAITAKDQKKALRRMLWICLGVFIFIGVVLQVI